jgi:hypothetical protein
MGAPRATVGLPMDRGSRRTLVVLLLIFAALLLVGLVVSTREVNAPAEEYPFLRVFPAMDENAIAALRLTEPASGLALTMLRNSTGWETDAGNTMTTEAALIARTIAGLPYQQILPEPVRAMLPTYGLGEDSTLRIEVVMQDGSTHAALVGDLAPTGMTYYALADDRPGVLLLLRPAVDYLITALRNPPVS